MDSFKIKRSSDNDEYNTKKQKQEIIEDKDEILTNITEVLNKIDQNLKNKYVCVNLSNKIPYVTYKVGQKPFALLRLNDIIKLRKELDDRLNSRIWNVNQGANNDIIINYVDNVDSKFGITFPDDQTIFRIHISIHSDPLRASDFSFHLTFRMLQGISHVNLLQTSSKNFTDSKYQFDTIQLEHFLRNVKNYTKNTYKTNRNRENFRNLMEDELNNRVEVVIENLSAAIRDFEKTLTSIVNREKLTKSASSIIGEDSENLPNMYNRANEYKKLYLDNCKKLDNLYIKLGEFRDKYLTLNDDNFQNDKILEYNTDIKQCNYNINQIDDTKIHLDNIYISIDELVEDINSVIDTAIAKDITKEKKFEYKQKYLKYKAKYFGLKNN